MADQPLPTAPTETPTLFEKMKIYLVEVVLNKLGPVAAASLLSLITAFAAAHNEILEEWGVNYIADFTPAWLVTHAVSGHVLLIELDTVSIPKIITYVTGAIIGILVAGHHVKAAVTGAPQSGGQRASDQ